MNTIDEYIAQFDGEIKERLIVMRNTIQSAALEATEKISYQMPTFYLNGNLVHFAAQKNHIGFYPSPSAIETFKDKLTEYKTSKGAIQFLNSKPLPLALITEIVKFRIKEQVASVYFKKEFSIALEIAKKAHKEQKDKVGADYILHPKQVSEYCVSPRAKIAALLHDVVEDSEISLRDLQNAGIGKDVVAVVDCLTKREGESLDDYYNRIASDDIAVEVKFADMRHNSDQSRWPADMKRKAMDNAYKYWRRMEQLYNLVGKAQADKMLSDDMSNYIMDCILESHQ